MMIRFTKTVGESERRFNYLNLSDDDRNSYGGKFPPERTPLWIETSGRRYKASKRGANQIWGELNYWYKGEHILAGSVIEILYDPDTGQVEGRVPVKINVLEPAATTQQVEPTEAPIESAEVSESETVEIPLRLEQDLEDFLVRNLNLVEQGLSLFYDETGLAGRQYDTKQVGKIDILAKKGNELVVIELKKGRGSDSAVGQISRYLGWVKDNLAQAGQSVRGIIIVHDFDPELKYAVMGNPNLQLKYYEVQLKFIDETAAANKTP